jgi:Ca2+-binding EF-hand superfamily protein
MRKLTLAIAAGAAAIALGGGAYAQSAPAQRELTRAAVQQRADQAFDRLDANHDGKLDQSDRQARQKIRFDRIDANHDGAVSYAEFAAAHARADVGRKGRMAEGRDHHQHGRHLFAMRGFSGHRGMMADAGKDGAMSKAEFQSAALERFDRLDANHDGILTREETKAARDNMRRQWQSRRQARNS